MADNSKLIYGGDLMLFIGSGSTKNPLAFSTSAKLSVNTKTREISSKDSGNWTEKLAGKFDWNCSTDALLSYSVTGSTTSCDVVYQLFLAGQPINVAFAVKTGSSPYWTADATKKAFSGQGIIESMDITAGDNDTATYSISIAGSGALALS